MNRAPHFFSANCGIKKSKPDLLVIKLPKGSVTQGVFTLNKLRSPTIDWTKKALEESKGQIEFILVNSGNANAMTGEHGIIAIEKTCSALADIFKTQSKRILVASTGVIGQKLPYQKIIKAYSKLFTKRANLKQAALAITTTDKKIKITKVNFKLANQNCQIFAIAKGSGMIAPNMATMLVFAFINIHIPKQSLIKILKESVETTFNSLSVDGDTSTNDMVLLTSYKNKLNSDTKIKTNHSAQAKLSQGDIQIISKKLESVFANLTDKIASDGEGSSKIAHIEVCQAKTYSDARSIAKTIAVSPLFKTAITGNDPNWGRIAMAIGNSDVCVDESKIVIKIQNSLAYNAGIVASDIALSKLSQKMKNSKTISVIVELGLGSCFARFTTCNLSKEYIDINSSYTS